MNARLSLHAPAWCAIVLSSAVALPAAAQDRATQRTGPRVLFSVPLQEMPGMNLTVVELASGPNPEPPSTAERHRRGHRHPGSVLVYVTQGAMRMALEGEPVQVVQAGETFFEPPRAHHIINENASATEPSRAIAVMIVPDGEPLTVPDPE
jgi:mannose-6-phosphate isomerase-like protein (cupin superfamily)